MKKELKSGILSADKSADCRPTVGGANVIAVLCNVLWPICWHCKILIFDVSLDINGQLRQKVKYMIITLPEAKRFMFLSRLPF